LVREDSTRASIWHDRIKVSEVCQELEERYELIVVDGRTAGPKPGATWAEDEKAKRMGVPEPDRIRLERLVRGAAASSRDEGAGPTFVDVALASPADRGRAYRSPFWAVFNQAMAPARSSIWNREIVTPTAIDFASLVRADEKVNISALMASRPNNTTTIHCTIR
jgi:hypothetical protein